MENALNTESTPEQETNQNNKLVIKDKNQKYYIYANIGVYLMTTLNFLILCTGIYNVAEEAYITRADLLSSTVELVAYLILLLFVFKLHLFFITKISHAECFRIAIDNNSFSFTIDGIETRGVLTDIDKIVLDNNKYRLTINSKYLYIKTIQMSKENQDELRKRLREIKQIEVITI